MDSTNIATDQFLTAEIKLYYDLFVPPDAEGPAPLLIAVHGYGAHKRYMMREAMQVAPAGTVIASVQGPHHHYRKTDEGYRVGFGWLSDKYSAEYVGLHHRFLLDLIERLAADGTIDSRRVSLYGFSQACALNFRFAFTYPEAVERVVGVCGGIPGDLETNDIYKPLAASTLYLYGDDDEFYTDEQFKKFTEKLSERIEPFTAKQYRAGHEITEEMRQDIRAFLKEA